MTDLQALWKYQKANLELDELKKKINCSKAHLRYKKLHKQLSELQNTKESLQKIILENGTELTKFGAVIDKINDRYDIELSEIESMKNDDECTADEVAESTRCMEALLKDVKRLKNRIMQILDTLSKAQTKLEEVLLKGGRAKKEYDIVKAQCIEEDASYKSNIEALEANIADKAKDVKDLSLLRKFEAIKKHHPDPIALVNENKCSGCQMGLPTALVYKVVSNHELIECENCGRLLCNKTDIE